MKTLIDKDGIEWHYDDDLFLGEENIKLYPCYFAEYFPATVDPDDDLMSVCACHMVGFRTKNNPGDVCKGDPRKCPMVDGNTFVYDQKYAEIKSRLETAEKFLMSAANYGLGIQQARKYFGQDNPSYINSQDPPGYDELEVYEGEK